MKDVINIDGEQYRKVTHACALCGAIGLHNCSGGQTTVGGINNIQCKDTGCAWDYMPETHPGSGIKIGGLVCTCKKCSIYS